VLGWATEVLTHISYWHGNNIKVAEVCDSISCEMFLLSGCWLAGSGAVGVTSGLHGDGLISPKQQFSVDCPPVTRWVQPLSCSTPPPSSLLLLLRPSHPPRPDALHCMSERCRPSSHRHTHTCCTPSESQLRPRTLRPPEHTFSQVDGRLESDSW